jgi:hypothetical protein
MSACEKFRPLLSEWALGDLDAEPARDVRAHLASCAACRVEEASVSRTLGLLKSDLPPSTTRRLKVVEAMVEARGGAGPSRRTWMAAAAGAVAAAGAALIWSASAPDASLRATAVAGRADLFRTAEGVGRPLLPGERVRPGDRVVVAGGGEARLEGRGVTLVLGSAAAIGLASDGRIALERGSLRAEGSVSVLDTFNDQVTLRSGRAWIGLREVRGQVAGSFETRDGDAATPKPRDVTTQRLTVKVDQGEADLDGSQRQRLVARPGQEGSFEFDGRPFTK